MAALETIAAIRHTITIAREPGRTWRSKNSIGVDAYQAVISIPGAFDVKIESETLDVAVISYVWQMSEKYSRTAEHLAGRGLRRIDWL